MKLIRIILGAIILFLDRVNQPKVLISRSGEEQARVNEATRNLKLYQFNACPFCVKVRRELRRLALQIELKDAQNNPEDRKALETEGGMLQVPCLKIQSGQETKWLYESDAIIEYLRKNYSGSPQTA